MREGKRLLNFWADDTKIKQFSKKHKNVSEQLRNFIDRDLKPDGEIIQRDDINGLEKIIRDTGSKPIQLFGDVEIGKTEMMKKIMKNNNNIFVVLDMHNEYDFLPTVDNIPTHPTESVRIFGDENIESSCYKFRDFGNKIMKNKWSENIIFVIEEGYRFKTMPSWFSFDIRSLLAEARKFGKLIVVSQDKLVDFCPSVRVVE